MNKTHYISEAARYEMLAEEAVRSEMRGTICALSSPEYRKRASEHRRKAEALKFDPT